MLSIGLAYEILQQTSSRKKGNLKEEERWNRKELKEKDREAQEDVFGNAGAGDAKKRPAPYRQNNSTARPSQGQVRGGHKTTAPLSDGYDCLPGQFLK